MDDETLHELFASLQPIAIRRMFGGKSVYADGRIIAVVLDGELFLKTDEQSATQFAGAGARQWTYSREGRSPVAMPYHSLPDDAWDDSDRMAEWAALAVDAAVRHDLKKPAVRKGRTPAS